MKKLGMFLIAVVMVAGLAGCNKGGDDSIEVVIALAANCSSYAAGTFTNVSTGYQTGVMTIVPNQSLTVELPEAGLYRIFFRDNSGYWDFTQNFTGDEDYPLILKCK